MTPVVELGKSQKQLRRRVAPSICQQSQLNWTPQDLSEKGPTTRQHTAADMMTMTNKQWMTAWSDFSEKKIHLTLQRLEVPGIGEAWWNGEVWGHPLGAVRRDGLGCRENFRNFI